MPTSENDKTKPKMVNITINLPYLHVDSIEMLRQYKLIPNRSEFIRGALRDFLKEELTHFKDLDQFHILLANHPFVENMKRSP